MRFPGAFRVAPVDTFEEHGKLGRCQVDRALCSLRPNKATAFQALGKEAQSVTIPPQQLNPITAPATEDEDVTTPVSYTHLDVYKRQSYNFKSQLCVKKQSQPNTNYPNLLPILRTTPKRRRACKLRLAAIALWTHPFPSRTGP